MSGENQKGFTIIEVSMFLGISALLMVGLISGITLSIQRQRYTDSVQSTQSFLQRQFNETLNTINNREQNCGASPNIQRGASDCLVLGKLISFSPGSPGSDEIRVRTIISTTEPTEGELEAANSEDTVWQLYAPVVRDDSNEESYNIPWGAEVQSANLLDNFQLIGDRTTGTPVGNISNIAVLRSPKSGATFVYSFDTNIDADNNISAMLSTANLRPSQICIASQDFLNNPRY